MPTEWAWPIISGFFALWAVWERIAAWRERATNRDRESELLERLHRRERMQHVAARRPVEPEPEPEEPVLPPMMDVGPPPNGHEEAMIPGITMNDETEAMYESLRQSGKSQEEILRILSRQ